MPKPAAARATGPSSSSPFRLDINDRAVDLSVRVETRITAEARVRESVSPVHNSTTVVKRLFNPSPSSSTSPPFPASKVNPRAVDKHTASGPTYARTEEDDVLQPGGSPVASEGSSATSSHVSEDLPSPSPPPKRVRKAETIDYEDSRDDIRDNLSSPRRASRPSKKPKRPSSMEEIAEPADLATELSEKVYDEGRNVPVHISRRTESISPRVDTRPAPRAVQRRKLNTVDSLQGLIDWTWPAVQQNLKDSR